MELVHPDIRSMIYIAAVAPNGSVIRGEGVTVDFALKQFKSNWLVNALFEDRARVQLMPTPLSLSELIGYFTNRRQLHCIVTNSRKDIAAFELALQTS